MPAPAAAAETTQDAWKPHATRIAAYQPTHCSASCRSPAVLDAAIETPAGNGEKRRRQLRQRMR